MSNIEHEYLGLLQTILDKGTKVSDRTGTGTLSIFGAQIRHDLSKGFPLLTTKKVFWKGVVEELLWMLRGETNIRSLQDKGVHIWDEWADIYGNLGPVYGQQWRKWFKAYDGFFTDKEIDQVSNVINEIKTNPDSRRLIVTAWNPADIDLMKLPPCHCFFQFRVINNKLSCQLYQRSADMFLGVPFNIASYALLTHMIAKVCNLEVGEFIHTFGDAHIYLNHLDQVTEQLNRESRKLPTLVLEDLTDIDAFTSNDIMIDNYNPHPAIKAPVSI